MTSCVRLTSLHIPTSIMLHQPVCGRRSRCLFPFVHGVIAEDILSQDCFRSILGQNERALVAYEIAVNVEKLELRLI